MTVLETLGFYIGLVYATWLFFLAIMALLSARNNGKLTKGSEIMATPILIVGWLLDSYGVIADSYIRLRAVFLCPETAKDGHDN